MEEQNVQEKPPPAEDRHAERRSKIDQRILTLTIPLVFIALLAFLPITGCAAGPVAGVVAGWAAYAIAWIDCGMNKPVAAIIGAVVGIAVAGIPVLTAYCNLVEGL